MANDNKWKLGRDNLYRGDKVGGVSLPTPKADPSIVRHIMYLEGYGRDTPYLSCGESRDVAANFGVVYKADPVKWPDANIKHRSKKELQDLLEGKGKGAAAWKSALTVSQARVYVEQWGEHLADFTGLIDKSDPELRAIVDNAFIR